MKMIRLFAAALLALQISLASFADSSSDTRAAFLQVIDRPRVASKPELSELPAVEGLKKQHLWFSADATERVPGYLLLPDSAKFKGKRPVVIALHGTGGNKEGGEISGIILEAMGIPTTMFTAIFAMARTVGWVAQWNEMIEDPEQKIGRPRQRYTGHPQRGYLPIGERA